MKRLITIAVFAILLTSGVEAGDFLDSLRQYHAQILRHLNVDTASTGYLTSTQTAAFVREGIVAVVPPIRAMKTIRVEMMSYNNNIITLDSDVVGIIAVQWSKNDSIKSMLQVPKEKWFQMDHRQTYGEEGYALRPSYYSYVEGYLSLYPVPTNPSQDTLKITCWIKAPNIASTSSFSSVPVQYRVAILYYAIWQAAQAKGHPQWKDWRDNFYNAKQELNATLGQPQISGSGATGYSGGVSSETISAPPSAP